MRHLNNWLKWIQIGSYPHKSNSLRLIGRLILSLWITILVLTGLVVAGISIINPDNSDKPENLRVCQTLEHNEEAIDTCEYLNP